jgi:CxxC motif-containing protein (DUF1111 family)
VGVVTLGLSNSSIAQHAESAQLIEEGRVLFAKVWTASEGLGPRLNARSCSGCHSTPDVGGSGTDSRAFVLVSPEVTDPTGGRVFRRFRVEQTGAVTEQPAPRNGTFRKAPSLFGSSVIEAVPETEFAGRAIARFGWKGRFATIEDAVEAAFVNELGLTSARYPDQPGSVARDQQMELSRRQIQAVSAFVKSLAAPVKKTIPSDERAQRLFRDVGCAACHRPSFSYTEERSLFPYTDLLVHDMGPGLADGITEPSAGERDFRTPPLWGIGRSGPPYLHDGRAKSLDDAIVLHGGEAESAVVAWRRLSADDRNLLIDFLRSL